MDGIYTTDDNFKFDMLKLLKPTIIAGGNYFIKLMVNNMPLYIQPPKCSTKNGVLKAGKRYYTDLLFDSNNDDYIRWMENLVNHCQQQLFNNRDTWFDGNMEMHDIENYFTSPLKSFKSGKYYSTRITILSNLGNISTKIYDETENEVSIENIDDKSTIITILEVSGIKCTATSFQIELILKQMLLLKPTELFQKCIIKMKSTDIIKNDVDEEHHTQNTTTINNTNDNIDETYIDVNEYKLVDTYIPPTPYTMPNEVIQPNTSIIINTDSNNSSGLEEIIFDLDNLPETENITLKKRNDVYFEMYREAKQKAKDARDLALTTYLEVKRIKNTYLLNEVDEDEDEDQDEDQDEDHDHVDGDHNIETIIPKL